jgi:hypothetical protein
MGMRASGVVWDKIKAERLGKKVLLVVRSHSLGGDGRSHQNSGLNIISLVKDYVV